MNKADQTPYARLNPDTILHAVESTGYFCTGGLMALNSYENRVYQIEIEDSEPLIAKFYRPHRWTSEAILEEHQFSLELVDHEIPIVAPLIIREQTLHQYQDFRFALFQRRGGHGLELDNDAQLEWMGRFLGRLHRVSAGRSFQHRIQLDTHTYGEDPCQFLLEHHFIPDYLQDEFCKTIEIILSKIKEIFACVSDVDSIRLHGVAIQVMCYGVNQDRILWIWMIV